ncbi:MAG: glucose-6-phosphate dehydrogenase [Nocardia sp.]|nr:glucose-6-phosphate dehydrogenase [Nocardia sp.]
MISRLVVFGGSGDLTGRYLLPGLAALRAGGHVGPDFDLVCADLRDWDDAHYREWAGDQLERHAGGVSSRVRRELVERIRYRRVDIRSVDEVSPVVHGGGPVVVYLALAPALFPAAIETLRAVKLPAGSRIVLEKPFGQDLAGAQRLNGLLAEVLPEGSIFRVDHFLAMTTVQNVLGSRLGNRVLESLWNSAHIERMEIIWDETLTLEGRAGYYDRVGALKDMLQNHLLQLMCLVAMEPPISFSERDLRDRKVDVLRSVRPLTDADIGGRTRRGRYTAGRIGQRHVPSYVDEPGVDPGRRTETFAEVELRLDNWRWSGTAFILRSGKALTADRKEVAVYFRPVPGLPPGCEGGTEPNVLRFGLDPENITLSLTAVGSSIGSLAPITLTAPIAPPELPEYGRLLLNVLVGDPSLSVRADEAEYAWRVLEPVISGWDRDLAPLRDYPAGSAGPGRESGES